MSTWLYTKILGLPKVLTHPRLIGHAVYTNYEIRARVTEIVGRVQKEGDKALVEYTQSLDDPKFKESRIRITPEEITEHSAKCPNEVRVALAHAAERIALYHQEQLPKSFEYTDKIGVTLGNRWCPLERVGIYVPGGKASYPSSVLMNAIPARVAGVKEIAMVVPSPKGVLNPLILAAAEIVGITEIYRVGGAQAIAALTYGTETVRPVDKIVGPGNAYVAEAKRQVFGRVGIDMIAGPSEILVVADQYQNPEWVAADLLSQAEHDENSRAIFITESESLAFAVEKAINTMLTTLPRAEIAHKSWTENGVILIAQNQHEILDLINYIASEHLELCVENPRDWLPEIRHAGAIFIGRLTPEAIGDYTAGPSHVLPTSGTARFSSGLAVYEFLRRQSIIECSPEGFNALADKTALLANCEGLDAHARSITIRRNSS